MPVCVKCKEMFPPNYVEITEGPVGLDGEYPKKCIFCIKGIARVERETARGSGVFVEYTREQCIIDYREFLAKLKQSRNVQDIINKDHSGFKM